MKKLKSIRKLIWLLLNTLPDHTAENWVRKNIRINEKDLSRFTVKVANQQDEFEQGYRLLYECYLEQGYLASTTENSLRITKYHLMPTSTMFVVKDKNDVIATLTHVIDSKIGLPCDQAVDLKMIKKNSVRVAEISALAIKKGYRRQHSIMFALTRLVYHFSTKYAGCDTWVICVSSYVELYYRSLFFFKRILNKKFKYQFVNDIQSSALSVSLNELPTLFKYFYDNESDPKKNLYRFYVQDQDKIFNHFPESIIRGATTPTLTVELIQYFFKNHSNVWHELTSQEKQEVLNAYHDEQLLGLGELIGIENVLEKRQSPRRLTNIRCEVVQFIWPYQEYSQGLIVNISSRGFLLRSLMPLDLDFIYDLAIQVSTNLKLNLQFHVLRQTDRDHFACLVEPSDQLLWKNYFKKVEDFCDSFTKPVLDDIENANSPSS
jgi:hypothetical protein